MLSSVNSAAHAVGNINPASDADVHIHVKQVDKVFGKRGAEVVALKGIDLDIRQGEFVCLLGPSGCGKSTLLNAMAGFSLPSAGKLEVGGKPVRAQDRTGAWSSRNMPCSPG